MERQDFPFAGPFSSFGAPAPVRADRNGRFRFFVPSLFSATRLRVLTRTCGAGRQPAGHRTASRCGSGPRRAGRRAARCGSAAPWCRPSRTGARCSSAGRGAGAGCSSRGGDLRALAANRSRYGFKVSKRRARRAYRVRVFPRDGGAHVSGTSRRVAVRGLSRR